VNTRSSPRSAQIPQGLEFGQTEVVRHRSIGALFGLRLVLVSNIVILTAIGALCLVYYERPEAYVFAGSVWSADALLVWLVRFTDPYREPRHRRRAIVPDDSPRDRRNT
jgi:hypothetical protein